MGGEHDGGADFGLAGEGHLMGAGEDAHARRVGGVGRGQHEGRLAVVHLGGERLHLRIAQAPRIGENGELVAAEAGFREDVDSLVGIAAHGRLPAARDAALACLMPPIAPAR